MTRTTPIMNKAPYLYLSDNNTTGNYLVFVIVPTNPGYTVEFNKRIEQDGTVSKLSFSLKPKSGNTTTRHEFRLDVKPVGFPGMPFDPNTFSVQVSVDDEEDRKTRTSRLFYKEADAYDADLAQSQIAHDCPYLYLTHTNSEYTPYCLIPLSTEVQAVTPIPTTDKSKPGSLLQPVSLQTRSSNWLELDPATIPCNNETYQDQSTPPGGTFQVDIQIQTTKPKRKKGTISNISSDTN